MNVSRDIIENLADEFVLDVGETASARKAAAVGQEGFVGKPTRVA